MESPVLIFRLFTLAIVALNAVQFVTAVRKPPEWRYPDPQRYPMTFPRNVWIVGSVLGVAAGIAVLAYSFVLF